MKPDNTMNFDRFKKEWADAMVYTPKEFDYENTMHELYIEYKQSNFGYLKGKTVSEWCEFFHQGCDLDEHPYMLKEKAMKTHHSNSLRQSANNHRQRVGLPPVPLIEEPTTDKKERGIMIIGGDPSCGLTAMRIAEMKMHHPDLEVVSLEEAKERGLQESIAFKARPKLPEPEILQS